MREEREKMREEMQKIREEGGDKLKEDLQSMREKMKEEREKALNAGCDEFILKPVDYTIIQRTIQRLSR